MDLAPILVQPNSAPAPSAPPSATGRSSFADVLSSQPGSGSSPAVPAKTQKEAPGEAGKSPKKGHARPAHGKGAAPAQDHSATDADPLPVPFVATSATQSVPTPQPLAADLMSASMPRANVKAGSEGSPLTAERATVEGQNKATGQTDPRNRSHSFNAPELAVATSIPSNSPAGVKELGSIPEKGNNETGSRSEHNAAVQRAADPAHTRPEAPERKPDMQSLVAASDAAVEAAAPADALAALKAIASAVRPPAIPVKGGVAATGAAQKSARVTPPVLPQTSEARPEVAEPRLSEHHNATSGRQDAVPAAPMADENRSAATTGDEPRNAQTPAAPAVTKDGASSPSLHAAPPTGAVEARSSEGPAAQAPTAQAQAAPHAAAIPRDDAPAVVGLSGLSKSGLIERFRQSELHFGLQAGEFGRVEIRTSLDQHEVSARISVERGELSHALQSELPGLHKRLNDLDVPMARITLHEGTAAMAGDSSRRSREQQWTPGHASHGFQRETETVIAALSESPAVSAEGLSIRI